MIVDVAYDFKNRKKPATAKSLPKDFIKQQAVLYFSRIAEMKDPDESEKE